MQAERPEVTVLGGVNGDFFYGGITVDARNNLLHGVMYRRGVASRRPSTAEPPVPSLPCSRTVRHAV